MGLINKGTHIAEIVIGAVRAIKVKLVTLCQAIYFFKQGAFSSA
jgi:hypothetical protein